MRHHGIAYVLPLTAASLVGQGRIEEIPLDWNPADLRAITVVAASASSTLAEPPGQYAPSRAVDGNRGSKWVGSVAPSADAPQWLRLDLPCAQEVAAVALFGEEPGNDGFVSGAIQVLPLGGETFVTVAAIDKAPSRAWLARFEPIKTAAVRVLITNSDGPSTHTDIHEVLVLGPPWTPEAIRAYAEEQLAEAGRLSDALREQAVAAPADSGPLRRLRTQAGAVATEVEAVRQGFGRWDTLSEADRLALVGRIEQLALRATRLAARLTRGASSWSPRAAEIARALALAEQHATAGEVAEARDGERIVLVNDHLIVEYDLGTGIWGVTWRNSAQTAIRGVGCAVEVAGASPGPTNATTEVVPFTDRLRAGRQIRATWGQDVAVERSVCVYRDLPLVVVSGRIRNDTTEDVALGTVRWVEVDAAQGWWHSGEIYQAPGAVTVSGSSELVCRPVDEGGEQQGYGGTQVLALAHREPDAALLVGFLSAREARPDLAADFELGEGGTNLSARQRFLGRRLPPGQSIEPDPVALGAWPDGYQALERYGDAVAAWAPTPVKTGANSLWCSWYAHRMAMTEDLVLANAAVAARHFAPLGMTVIQLDHGWQRGDITGDWLPNERFPHGLRHLADELHNRYGLALGVWIAPTDVAETSETFRAHPDWMLRGDDGRPRVNWKWYWAPNPDCYELDASHPEAERFIEETFARLSAEGVRYYKIDFIAACGGEHFAQHDPSTTRGWGVLRRAMEAIRRGAGEDAWIRYCQTPPLLSVGLANSAYGGNDTLDAGTPASIGTLRSNARSLAAGWWLNDRLYHREVCDMSVRRIADVEETRLRLALMTLAGCSISFSDEFQYLPPSRIRMMQQCLPPGAPTMRPLDLFERDIPSVWRLHCAAGGEDWEVIGLFNLDDDPAVRTIDLTRLGYDDHTPALAFEFWEARLLGRVQRSMTLTLPPRSSRIVRLCKDTGRPQVIGTDMHLFGGYHELRRIEWDNAQRLLVVQAERAPGLEGRIYVHVPPAYRPVFHFPLDPASAPLTRVAGDLWMAELHFEERSTSVAIPFEGPETPPPPPAAIEPNEAGG